MNNETSDTRYPNQDRVDLDQLLKAAVFILTGVFSLQETQNLVNDAEFWKWLQKTNRAGFASSSSIQKLAQKNPEYLKKTLRSKGMEHTWTSNYNSDLLNFFSVAELSESPNDPIGDAYIKDILTGQKRPVQMKTSKKIPNDPTRTFRNAKRHIKAIPCKYPEGTRIVGNQPVVDAAKGSRSYDHEAYPIERGWSDKEQAKFITSHFEKARKREATPVLTTKAVVSSIAKCALIGALLLALIETFKDWRVWREQRITGDEFFLRILKQGGKGALLGGGIGAFFLLLSTI